MLGKDRYWNQMIVNKGAENLLGWLLAGKDIPEAVGSNLMKLMLHPQGVKARVVSWDAIATHLIHRVYRETLAGGKDEQSQALFDELLTYPGVRALWQSPIEDNWQMPLLSTTFSNADRQLSFFTTLTTLGTPQDITLQELRLECLFPADDATEDYYKVSI